MWFCRAKSSLLCFSASKVRLFAFVAILACNADTSDASMDI